MTKYKTFWHCTPKDNIDNIMRDGIDPAYSKNISRKLVWFCEWRGLPHMLAHVSARHNVSVTSLAVIRIRVKVGEFTHHRLSMYYSSVTQKRGFKVMAGDKALAAWEAQREGARRAYGFRAKR